MNTCKMRKYWVKESYNEEAMTCECLKMNIGYQYNLSEIESDEVWIENDEGWGWIVGPDFGCIHFTNKKE